MTGQPRTTSTTTPRPVPARDDTVGPGRAVALLIAAVCLSVVASLMATSALEDPAPTGTSADPAPSQPEPQPTTDTEAQPVEAASISRSGSAVPDPVGARAPTTVQVELTTEEVEGQLADGTAYSYWTFGGTVPGPMIRVRQGDMVELTLTNSPESTTTHSIDLHAVNGPGGGAGATQVAPGQSRTVRFQAKNPGVYVYHCASPHIPSHIAMGMYGLIVVEPAGGLAPVDREFYVMQGEIYTDAPRGTPGRVGFDGAAMTAEDPTYVVFNGAVQALAGEGVLTASVGDRVRLFVGNGGPNLISSFHVIGEIFDTVHVEGGSQAQNDVQTTLVPADGATWVEFTVDVPGDYLLVDHSITRAVDKGALGVLHVTGPEDPSVFDAPEAPEAATADEGPQQSEQEDGPAGRAAGVSEITMTEFAYSPDQLSLPAGTHTLRITNDGAIPHELTLGTAGQHTDHFADTGIIAAGKTVELTVTLEPGTYEFACHIPGHYEQGMYGTVEVTGA